MFGLGFFSCYLFLCLVVSVIMVVMGMLVMEFSKMSDVLKFCGTGYVFLSRKVPN